MAVTMGLVVGGYLKTLQGPYSLRDGLPAALALFSIQLGLELCP